MFKIPKTCDSGWFGQLANFINRDSSPQDLNEMNLVAQMYFDELCAQGLSIVTCSKCRHWI